MNKKKRVFLSYSYKDTDKVRPIISKLIENNIEVYDDSGLTQDNTLKEQIKYAIEGSEILLVFLSKNFLMSDWTKFELSTFLDESYKREISVLPIVIEKTDIPSDLIDYEIINLTKNYEIGLEKIIKKLKIIPEISFIEFSFTKFEELVVDLLIEYNFKNILMHDVSRDQGYDIKAEYETKTPFGTSTKETWIVEIKFYRQERFSINAIRQLLAYNRNQSFTNLHLLLVTNSILNSAVQEYIEDINKIEHFQIEVIDGVRLKKLISNRKRLLDKYFKL